MGLSSAILAPPFWVRIRLWRGPFASYKTPPRPSLAKDHLSLKAAI
jgi:hypothetical protein